MVEIIDIVYASVPLIGFLSLLVWHGAHQVSAIMAVILVLMAPVVYFIVHAEKFDEYWVKREAAKPAEVEMLTVLWTNELSVLEFILYTAVCRGHDCGHNSESQIVF